MSFAALFFVPIINVRTLSQAEYGTYRQFWLLYDTVYVILVMSFPASLLYYFPRAENKNEKSMYLTQTLAYLIVMGLVSWLVYAGLRFALKGELGDVVRDYTWAFSLFTLFMMVSRSMERLFVAEKKAEAQAAYVAVLFSTQALVIIGTSWFYQSVNAIIWALVIFAFANFVFTMSYTGWVYRPSIRSCSWRSFKEQLSFALPLGLATIVLLVFGQTDKYLITHFLGREVFAVYSVGAMQLPFVDILRNSVMNVLFPLMAEHQKQGEYEEILRLWRRATVKISVVFFPIFVFLEVSARPFITILFTEEYAAAASVFMIYLLVFLRSTVDTTTVLMVFKKNAFMFRVNVIVFLCYLALAVTLYKRFGWLGVPSATAAALYAQNFVFLWKSARLLDQSVLGVMPWKDLFLRFATAGALGAALYAVYRVAPAESFFELAAAGAAYFAVYFGLCVAFRFAGIADIKSMMARR